MEAAEPTWYDCAKYRSCAFYHSCSQVLHLKEGAYSSQAITLFSRSE